MDANLLLLLAGLVAAAAWACLKARPARRRRRVITLTESDPNDAYTC